MKREDLDFTQVEPHHLAIHDRLLEWGRAQNNGRKPNTAPMFAGFESSHTAKAQLEAPRVPVDVSRVEQTNWHIRNMGERHRKAAHWHYCWNRAPAAGMRYIGCTKQELLTLLVDVRQILTMSLRRAGIVV